ncbi:hypothetical protein ASE77_11795 [Sphingomonas sp. Leaf226]|nr:hypothetical protein ASE77_11795 [Sphingomonas sp. Leaf226]
MAPPEERIQRAIVELADRAVSTRQMTQDEAASGALHAVHTLGKLSLKSDKVTFQWMRTSIDLMEAELEDRKRFPPL